MASSQSLSVSPTWKSLVAASSTNSSRVRPGWPGGSSIASDGPPPRHDTDTRPPASMRCARRLSNIAATCQRVGHGQGHARGRGDGRRLVSQRGTGRRPAQSARGRSLMAELTANPPATAPPAACAHGQQRRARRRETARGRRATRSLRGRHDVAYGADARAASCMRATADRAPTRPRPARPPVAAAPSPLMSAIVKHADSLSRVLPCRASTSACRKARRSRAPARSSSQAAKIRSARPARRWCAAVAVAGGWRWRQAGGRAARPAH